LRRPATYSGGEVRYSQPLRIHLEPCPGCGREVTLFDGARRYDPEGFPFVHECEPAVMDAFYNPNLLKVAVPNEGDFHACGLLTWGKPCPDCQRRPTQKPRDTSRIQAVRSASEGLPL
jgi:endogenous inhibitor of DNA gyrase (YacG/DUF329 family)